MGENGKRDTDIALKLLQKTAVVIIPLEKPFVCLYSFSSRPVPSLPCFLERYATVVFLVLGSQILLLVFRFPKYKDTSLFSYALAEIADARDLI